MKGGLRVRLLLADLVGLGVEGAAIAVPAYLLYGVQYGRAATQAQGGVQVHDAEVLQLGAQVILPVLLALVAFSVVYAIWQETRLRGLRRVPGSATATGRASANAEEIYLLAATLPRQTLWVRTLLWTACGTFCIAWLRYRGLPRSDVLPVLWIFSFNPLLAGAVHSLLYDRLLWDTPWRSLPDGPDPLRQFASRYPAELARAVLLCSAMALLCTVGFTVSIPFDLQHFQRAQRYLPGLFFLLLYLGYRYGVASCRPIRAYLNAATGAGDPVTRDDDADSDSAPSINELADRAYRAAQALPYRLGGAMVVSGVSAGVVLLFIFMPLLELPRESVVLILGVALSVTTAASLYAILWHRGTLRPLLGHLQERRTLQLGQPGPSSQPGPADLPDEMRAPLSLTAKMVCGFGLLVLCTCVLSLLWSFVQCKTLATHQIQRLARDRLDTILADLQREIDAGALSRPAGPDTSAGTAGSVASAPSLAPLLQRLTTQSGIAKECLVYYLPEGGTAAIVVGHPASMRPPALPAYPLSHLRQRLLGQLDLPRLRLTGEYERIQAPAAGPKGQPPLNLGTVAVLYPDYLHPGFQGHQESPLRGQLLALVFFFVVLVFVSVGVVVIAAVDLSRPVRYLERRAAAMAKGELNLPVLQTAVETDEVGRLTFAFEEMRRALSEKLRSSTQLNLRLESEVARRTAELSRRNQEVSEALGRLQLTRDELLRTEKLATMGRIAAGVTSEINNPVNAMSTLPDPMSEELDALLSLSQHRPLDRGMIAATLDELHQMVDILLRGAQRAKEIVRATRVYVRTGDGPAGPLDPRQVLDEILQLFADLPRYGVTLLRDYDDDLLVRVARSDLAQLLSSWLANVTPRLRDVHRVTPLVTLRMGARRREGGRVEIRIADNGPLLREEELAAFAEEGLVARLGAQVEARSQVTPEGNQTSLTVVLDSAAP